MKKILSFLLAILAAISISGQTDNIIGFRDQVNNYNVEITSLGGGEEDFVYAAARNMITFESYLIKLTETGSIVWQKKLPTLIHILSGDTFFTNYSQIKYHNNHIYVLGEMSVLPAQNSLLKIDEEGILVWNKTLTPNNPNVYITPSIEISSTNRIIISGNAYDGIDIFSLNEDGSANWVKNFITGSMEWKNPNFDICVTENGDIIGCAKAESDMSIYRLDADGNPKWGFRLIEPIWGAYTHIKSIIEIDSNRFLICGYRASSSSSYYNQGFYAFMDSLGNFTEFIKVSELYMIKNGIQLSNDNILLCGIDSNAVNPHYIEIQPNGNVVSAYRSNPIQITNSYISSTHGTYNSVVEKNSSFYLGDAKSIQRLTDFGTFNCFPYTSINYTFTSEDFSSFATDNYMVFQTPGTVQDVPVSVLSNSNLLLLAGCSEVMELNEPTNATEIKIYPTLLSSNESIFIQHEISTPLQYQIMDINGKMITKNDLVNNSISVNGLSNGMYVLRLISNQNVVNTTKFLVSN